MHARSYDQLCPIAVSLDLVGDRWALLVLRDLLWRGPHGYQELLDANPGLSPTVLAARLRTLCDQGLVDRIEVRRGRRSVVYRLSEAGRRIEPVIDALYGFGGALLATTPLTHAKVSYIVAQAARNLGDAVFDVEGEAMVRLAVGGVIVDIELAPGRVGVVGPVDSPDGSVALEQPAFVALVSGDESSIPQDALSGDPTVCRRLLEVLGRAAG
ncbi:MAG TPA: helix-turn-helix domain-containing protein [Acidimicrobiia bacterium]|jgi:DNA-binding HxlR family transcriptional regulator